MLHLRKDPLVIIFLAASLVGQTAIGAYLQAGYDEAKSGATPDAGPQNDDVAFALQLPGSRARYAAPLIMDGNAYVLTAGEDVGPGLDENAIWRINLSTAEAMKLIALDAAPSTFATDGVRFYVALESGIGAYAIAGGPRIWNWPLPSVVKTSHDRTICTYPALTADSLYVSCTEQGVQTRDVNTATDPQEQLAFAAAVDLTSGTQEWVRWWEPGGAATVPTGLPQPQDAQRSTVASRAYNGVTIVGSHAFVPLQQVGGGGALLAYMWVLNASDGSVAWVKNATVPVSSTVPNPIGQQNPAGSVGVGIGSSATGTPGTVFVVMDDLIAYEPATGAELWREVIGAGDNIPAQFPGNIAKKGDRIFITSRNTVQEFDVARRTRDFAYSVPNDALWHFSTQILAKGVLYARATGQLNYSAGMVYAFDPTADRVIWRHDFTTSASGDAGNFSFDMGLGDGVLVVAGRDGTVVVLGETAASMQMAPIVSSMFPAPGEALMVNLSATGPGVGGPASAFKAIWGDGAESEWQESPLLSHRYDDRGQYVARLVARNAAGQSASRLVTFDVGAQIPREPTWLETAFSAENQDKSFFAIGLALTATGAVAAYARVLAHRRRLQKEIRAVESAYEMTKTKPLECEMALTERRTRARGLLLNGAIDEAQFGIIEKRIDDLSAAVRLGTLDDQFDFLPTGMTKTLKALLADGHITKWERTHFLAALAQDQLLTSEQKTKVAVLIDDWFARDSEGANDPTK